MMHYLIYKITNRLNNKFYVGKHKTENVNDDYLGSGVILIRAIEKHGKENFIKEILFECKTEDEMNQREIDIVDEEFIARPDTYNVKLGGQGGWDYINKHGLQHTEKWKNSCKPIPGNKRFLELIETDESFREEFGQKVSNGLRLYYSNPIAFRSFAGKVHTDETKEKMSNSMKGKNRGKRNGSYGKHWITNGIENRKVDKNIVLDGWRIGRVCNQKI
jgi:hypothetical protein